MMYYIKFFIIIFVLSWVIGVIYAIYSVIFEHRQKKSQKTSDNGMITYSYTLSTDTSKGNLSSQQLCNIPKQIFLPSNYNIMYNSSQFSDNLNYNRYQYKAVFSETNRMRTRKIEAFTESEAIDAIKALGFTEPITIAQIPFDPPTANQIAACQKHNTTIPSKACSIDVSYIIDKEMNEDSISNPEMLQYATQMKIRLSYYIGERQLYSCVFDNLKARDKIAFFAFCIYRFLTNDRCGNLNYSPHKELLYNFADSKLCDKSFNNSMNRYSGEQLLHFGTLRNGNYEYYGGGSKNTIAYKEVMKFLESKHLI